MHILPGIGKARPGEVAVCFILILLSICFYFPVPALTAETQDKCTEKAEKEFQTCVKKAKNDKDRDACERQFAIDYDKCNVIWEEGSEE